MSTKERFSHKLGSEVYIPNFILKELQKMHSSGLKFPREVIRDMHNGGVRYEDLPTMLRVRIVGCKINMNIAGYSVQNYTCICEY